jgi:hypothetical protein
MDSEGCEGSMMVDVVEPDAIMATTSVDDADCNGDDSGQITVDATGGTGELSYSINGVDFQSDDEIEDLIADDYTVTIMDENMCIATVENVTVAQPEAIEISNTDVVLDSGAGDGSIDITVTGGTGSYTFEWEGPNGFTSDEQNISDLEAGDYTVTITDENDCELTSDIVNVALGLEEILANIDIKVMPNPSNGAFTLYLDGLATEKVNMTILDVVGKVVLSEQISSFGETRKDVNISNQANGIYFLQLNVGESVRTIKLVKNS